MQIGAGSKFPGFTIVKLQENASLSFPAESTTNPAGTLTCQASGDCSGEPVSEGREQRESKVVLPSKLCARLTVKVDALLRLVPSVVNVKLAILTPIVASFQ